MLLRIVSRIMEGGIMFSRYLWVKLEMVRGLRLTNRLVYYSDRPRVSSRISKQEIIWVKQYVPSNLHPTLPLFLLYFILVPSSVSFSSAKPSLSHYTRLGLITDPNLGHRLKRWIHYIHRYNPTPKRSNSPRCSPRSYPSTLSFPVENEIEISGSERKCFKPISIRYYITSQYQPSNSSSNDYYYYHKY